MSLAVVSANLWLDLGTATAYSQKTALGGPVAQNDPYASPSGLEDSALLGAPLIGGGPRSGKTDQNPEETPGIIGVSEGSIGGNILQNGVIPYTIQSGDTLSEIAARFGVSVQTITGANPGLKPSALSVGTTISILPVSGILYEVREGESLDSIASSFNLSILQIQEFNKSVDFGAFGPGIRLVIPGAKSAAAAKSSTKSSLASPGNYFALPATGLNWGLLHSYNAVDIANSCGSQVLAAAEGLAVPDSTYGSGVSGWNGGYGTFVLLEHPNGTKTRYAHLDGASVSVGDYVYQGDKIGVMGNTGNVHGVTGCHLHFEVYGAQNPFSK